MDFETFGLAKELVGRIEKMDYNINQVKETKGTTLIKENGGITRISDLIEIDDTSLGIKIKKCQDTFLSAVEITLQNHKMELVKNLKAL